MNDNQEVQLAASASEGKSNTVIMHPGRRAPLSLDPHHSEPQCSPLMLLLC